MKLYFGGGEVKSWRDLLIAQGITDVSLSFVGLKRRTKKTENWFINANFADNQSVFLDSGSYTLNRIGAEYSEEEATFLAHEYMFFVMANIDRLTLVSEFDALILGQETIEVFREDFYNDLPKEKFMPVWHEEYGTEELERLASQYDNLAVTNEDVTDSTLGPKLNSLVNQYGVKLHGSAITGREIMKMIRWNSVASTSWISPAQFGDTIIWTGKELKRYPRAYKDRARKQHRNTIVDAGFDANKIAADDPTEVLKLSLWSWTKFVEDVNAHKQDRVTNILRNEIVPFVETGYDAVDTQGGETGNDKQLAVRETRESIPLPIMGITHEQIGEDAEEQPFMFVRSESMRACNTCFLREKCPGFKPNANCLYNIPIEIKTREQLRTLQAALVEMQAQRVLFMKMAEDLEGGYADPNLSTEMDRLQRMISAKEQAEKEGFSFKVEASGPAGAGYFSRMFGDDAGQKLSAIEQPIMADEVIKESEIWEAEVVDDKKSS